MRGATSTATIIFTGCHAADFSTRSRSVSPTKDIKSPPRTPLPLLLLVHVRICIVEVFFSQQWITVNMAGRSVCLLVIGMALLGMATAFPKFFPTNVEPDAACTDHPGKPYGIHGAPVLEE